MSRMHMKKNDNVYVEALLMNTHNICFHEEIRKIFSHYPFLSGAMSNLIM